jgi:hypothetical protein
MSPSLEDVSRCRSAIDERMQHLLGARQPDPALADGACMSSRFPPDAQWQFSGLRLTRDL